jgi:hypothetical protein
MELLVGVERAANAHHRGRSNQPDPAHYRHQRRLEQLTGVRAEVLELP